MAPPRASEPIGGCSRPLEGVSPDPKAAPLAAVCSGISSGAAFAMVNATLTNRFAEYGIRKDGSRHWR